MQQYFQMEVNFDKSEGKMGTVPLAITSTEKAHMFC